MPAPLPRYDSDLSRSNLTPSAPCTNPGAKLFHPNRNFSLPGLFSAASRTRVLLLKSEFNRAVSRTGEAGLQMQFGLHAFHDLTMLPSCGTKKVFITLAEVSA